MPRSWRSRTVFGGVIGTPHRLLADVALCSCTVHASNIAFGAGHCNEESMSRQSSRLAVATEPVKLRERLHRAVHDHIRHCHMAASTLLQPSLSRRASQSLI